MPTWISWHVHGLVLLSRLGLRLGCTMGRRGPSPVLRFLLSERWQMFADELFTQKIRMKRATPLLKQGGCECHGLSHARKWTVY